MWLLALPLLLLVSLARFLWPQASSLATPAVDEAAPAQNRRVDSRAKAVRSSPEEAAAAESTMDELRAEVWTLQHPGAVLFCEVGEWLDDGAVTFDGAGDGRMHLVSVQGGAAILDVAPGSSGSGNLLQEGVGAVRVSWKSAHAAIGEYHACDVEFVGEATTVFGLVVESFGRPVDAPADVLGGAERVGKFTYVAGCGGGTELARSDGSFVMDIVPGEPCSIWVERAWGWERVTGDEVVLTPRAGEPIEGVRLVAPAFPDTNGIKERNITTIEEYVSRTEDEK